MEPRYILRVEGLSVVLVALGSYFVLDGPLWLLAVVALAPDLSMIGYVAGPRVGSLSYNLVHTYVLPISLAAVGLLTGTPIVVLIALVWAGHIGVDRFFGLGLKFESGFTDTHLS